MFSKAIFGLVLAGLLVYGFIEARPLLMGASLTISSPIDGAAAEGVVLIAGTSQRATTLTLNGGPLYPDENGDFSSMLALSTGTSILTFTASDRFGRTVTLTRTIYVP